jgi:molybdopterin-guanine dinucleotide biosynthesis protein A
LGNHAEGVANVYHQRVGDIAAFILAGGKSARMGSDKAFLEIGGRTLLSRALEIVAAVAPDVAIVGDGSKFFPLGRVVEDVYPEQGPLGGIHAALASSGSVLNLMLAVDMPYVEGNFLQYLLSEASRTSAVVTVPRLDRGWQPLCAVYRRDFAAVAEAALRKHKNKIDILFSQVETRTISQEEMARLNFSEAMFRNLNSPGDLDAGGKT